MAVSVDTVYQRVLTLANKEQRGYITPQEFNLLANQAQMEIFEQYFYDIKQFNRIPGNMEGYSDPLSILYEKIGEFELERDGMWMQTNMLVVANQFIDIPWDEIYKINSVRVGNAQVDMLNGKDFDSAMSLPLTRPTLTRPIGCITAQGLVVAIGENDFALPAAEDMRIRYIMRPPDIQWAYVIVNDKALFNANISVDFELHSSEETELVYRILKLAGINLKSPEIVQSAQTLEQTQIQQEKQ